MYDDEEKKGNEVDEGLQSLTETFAPELTRINETIDELNDLYSEVKMYFDDVVNSHTKVSLNFIHSQTSNLIALKTAKSTLLNQVFNIKKITSELNHKLNKGEDGEDGLSSKSQAMIRKFINENEKNVESTGEYYDTEDEDGEEEILEQALAQAEKKGTIKFTENEKAIKYEKQGVKLAVIIINAKKGKWKFIAIDRKYNEIEDYPLPSRKLYDMEFKELKNGDIVAIDQNALEYEVVEV